MPPFHPDKDLRCIVICRTEGIGPKEIARVIAMVRSQACLRTLASPREL